MNTFNAQHKYFVLIRTPNSKAQNLKVPVFARHTQAVQEEESSLFRGFTHRWLVSCLPTLQDKPMVPH